MAHPQKCSRCGAELARDVRGGQCLRCLLLLGLTPPGDPASLETPALTQTAPSSEAGTAEKPGDRIGRFRLLKQIGQGGFGVVFQAEQQEPVHRLVALKVIKLGMDTEQVIRRFETERQTLALLDHPNIAKILDGGTTNAGRPYFVMELLEGAKITDYCDAHRLSVNERLELFVQVCQAVQHAHQKGVIHRDIKPSNILVTELDGKPVPKVIDFGVAKATLGQRLTEEIIDTAFQGFAGTPAYMSPEQAGMGGLDIDSRSDIYSLGMLLYELLTDQPAFDPVEFRRAAIDEVFRIIREKEPPRPSTKLTTLASERLTAIAQRRQADPAKLPSALRGDLDWIVMRALEKNRDRRYETANGLAMDIQRHLNHEPVLASPPSRLYRLRKLFRRHRFACVSAAAVATALMLGLGLATWQYIRAEKARARAVTAQARAQTEADKSAQVAQFLKDMLGGVSPAVAQGRDATLLREILDKTSDRIGAELKNQPDVAADMRNVIGNVYEALGEYTKAETSLHAAVALNSAASNQDANLAASLDNLGVVLERRNKLPEAEGLHLQALGILTNLGLARSAQAAKFLGNFGNVLWAQGKLAEAESAFRQSLALDRMMLPANSEQIAKHVGGLATMLALQGKPAEAEPLFREALSIESNVLGSNDPSVARSLNNLGNALHDQGKLAEAEQAYRQALALRRRILNPEHPDLAYALNNLGALLNQEGKFSEAEPILREALDIRRKQLDTGHPYVALSLHNLAGSLWGQGKLTEAETLEREALAIRRKRFPQRQADVMESLRALAITLSDERKLPEAESLYREAATRSQELSGDGNSDLASILQHLAVLLQGQRNFHDEEPVLRDLLSCQKKMLAAASAPNPDSFRPLVITLLELTDILLAEDKLQEAEPVARETIATAQQHLPNDWRLQEARGLLGEDLAGQKNFTEAEPLLLSSYDGIKRLAAGIPDGKATRTKAIRRLVDFYTQANHPAEASKWTKELQALQGQ